MILRCTAKLQAIAGRPDPATASIPAAATDWYANLLWVNRRKCLLLTHAGTGFSVFASDVRASQLRRPGPFVMPLIAKQLAAEDMPAQPLRGEPRRPGEHRQGGRPQRRGVHERPGHPL